MQYFFCKNFLKNFLTDMPALNFILLLIIKTTYVVQALPRRAFVYGCASKTGGAHGQRRDVRNEWHRYVCQLSELKGTLHCTMTGRWFPVARDTILKWGLST